MALLFAAATFLLLAPTLRAYKPVWQDQVRYIEGREIAPFTRRPAKSALIETAEWLRHNTPETTGFMDASRQSCQH